MKDKLHISQPTLSSSIGNEFADAVHRQFVNVLPINIRNAGAQVNMLFDENHRIFDLLINRAFSGVCEKAVIGNREDRKR